MPMGEILSAMMSEAPKDALASAPHRGSTPEDSIHPAVPYVAMIALALLIGLALGIYLWFYRGEIIEILTQTPT
jgi:hypothetical protein